MGLCLACLTTFTERIRPSASSVRNLALSELARKQIAYELTKLSEKRMIDIEY